MHHYIFKFRRRDVLLLYVQESQLCQSKYAYCLINVRYQWLDRPNITVFLNDNMKATGVGLSFIGSSRGQPLSVLSRSTTRKIALNVSPLSPWTLTNAKILIFL